MKEIRLIGSLRKNASEGVRVHVKEYRGVMYVDARVWLKGTQGDTQTEITTRKGPCLRPDVVKELLPILAAARAKAQALEQADPDKGGFQ